MNFTSSARDKYANSGSPRSTSGMLDSPVATPAVPIGRSHRRQKASDYLPVDDNVFVEHYDDSNLVLLNAVAASGAADCVQNGTMPQRSHLRHADSSRVAAGQNLLQIADYHPDGPLRSSPINHCDLPPDCGLLEAGPTVKGALHSNAVPAMLDPNDLALRGALDPDANGRWTSTVRGPSTAARESQGPFYHKFPPTTVVNEDRETRLGRQDYRYLGRSGLRVSVLSLGTWVTFGAQISDEMAEQIVTLAYENGINYFDTAEVYGGGRAEVVLGNILKNKGWRRSSYVVSTKLFWGGKAETERGLSRKHIIEGLKNSLQRLQMDYVDIVYANKFDPHTPIEEIVRAFTFVINQGWAMYWGTSRWSNNDIMLAYSVARQFNLIPPCVEQAEYHLFQREKVEVQLPELMQKIGIGTITWSPLACGILTGKYDDGIPIYSRAALQGYAWLKEKILSDEGRRQQEKLRKLNAVANKLNCTLAQLAIAWCVKNNSVTSVLLGVSSVEQLYENLLAIKVSQKLTISVVKRIEDILKNNPGTEGLEFMQKKSATES